MKDLHLGDVIIPFLRREDAYAIVQRIPGNVELRIGPYHQSASYSWWFILGNNTKRGSITYMYRSKPDLVVKTKTFFFGKSDVGLDSYDYMIVFGNNHYD